MNLFTEIVFLTITCFNAGKANIDTLSVTDVLSIPSHITIHNNSLIAATTNAIMYFDMPNLHFRNRIPMGPLFNYSLCSGHCFCPSPLSWQDSSTLVLENLPDNSLLHCTSPQMSCTLTRGNLQTNITETPIVSQYTFVTPLKHNILFVASFNSCYPGILMLVHRRYNDLKSVGNPSNLLTNLYSVVFIPTAVTSSTDTLYLFSTEAKAVRLCANDTDFVSIFDIPLHCGKSNDLKLISSSNGTIFGVFLSKGRYLLCTALFSEIDSAMEKEYEQDRNKHNLHSKMKSKSAESSKDKKFTGPKQIKNPYLSCEDMHKLDPIYFSATKIFHMKITHTNEYQITSIFVCSLEKGNVVILGDTLGKVNFYFYKSPREHLIHYDTKEISNAPIKSLLFHAESNHLYGLTESKIFRISLANCKSYSTCKDCLRSKNPFCGWCLFSQRCTCSEECRINYTMSHIWLQTSCPEITSIFPKSMAASNLQKIKVNITGLPRVKMALECVFTEEKSGLSFSHKISEENIVCDPSSLNLLPFEGNAILKLAIGIKNITFTDSVSLNLYDCSQFQSCFACLSALKYCAWCPLDNRCYHKNEQKECLGSLLVQKTLNANESHLICPYYEIEHATNYVVPSGETLRIGEKPNILRIINWHRKCKSFKCLFRTDSSDFLVNARKIRDNRVICQEFTPSYTDRLPHISYQFDLLVQANDNRSGYYRLDSLDSINITVYKCQYMADRCGECLLIDPIYRCGWCMTPPSCLPQRSVLCHSSWLNPLTDVCTDPRIKHVYPSSVPPAGGTLLTITGSNFAPETASLKVLIGNQECILTNEGFIPTRRVLCHTPDLSAGEHSLLVIVRDHIFSEQVSFKVKEPNVTQIIPNFGPMAGGTLISLIGSDLGIGFHRTVFFGRCECILHSFNNTVVVCITSSLHTADADFNGTFVPLLYKIDMYVHSPKNIGFIYVPDPVIVSLSRYASIASGNLMVYAYGTGMEAVVTPILLFTFMNEGHKTITNTPCEVINATTIKCHTPAVPAADSSCINVNVSFKMDHVPVENVSPKLPFLVCPDPLIFPFKQRAKRMFRVDETICVEGSHLLRGLAHEDYYIEAFGRQCQVISMTSHQILCRPSLQPNISDPFVRVTVGNKTVSVGSLLPSGQHTRVFLTWEFIMFSVGFILFWLLIILSVTCVFIRRKQQIHEKNLKCLRSQIENLEIRVARECKEAFTELQTDMSEIANEIQSFGIPLYSFEEYCLNIMFPDNNNQSRSCMINPTECLLKFPPNRRAQIQRGLDIFYELLMTKPFLINFVSYLESDKSTFRLPDRLNFAIYLTIILKNDMVYFTEMLKYFLSTLIKNSENRKLLLRSNESVAEKMLTYWFSLLLHELIDERVGPPFFFLFLAIQYQIYKGPVDALTFESRYSLSEDKLLRQSVDYETRVVNVVIPSENMPYQVKALNCDSISQFSDKIIDSIFRALPFSKRPAISDIELEFMYNDKKICLADEDETSETDSFGFVKINDLDHYGIVSGSIVYMYGKHAPLNLPMDFSVNTLASCRNSEYQCLVSSESSSSSECSVKRDRTRNSKKNFHLTKCWNDQYDDRESRLVSEIYLTRLLATKGGIHKYMDDFFEVIFSTVHETSTLPTAIKIMFDFLDEQAAMLGVVDSEVVHTWKSNCLPLRFWVNLIKNPNFVFDVEKKLPIDACLSVIAQAFMDSCSTSTHELGKDSPSSKLLFHRDVQRYRKWVERYYADIKALCSPTAEEVEAYLKEKSRKLENIFCSNYALLRLYEDFVLNYKTGILKRLLNDEDCFKEDVNQKFEQMCFNMDSSHIVV